MYYITFFKKEKQMNVFLSFGQNKFENFVLNKSKLEKE